MFPGVTFMPRSYILAPVMEMIMMHRRPTGAEITHGHLHSPLTKHKTNLIKRLILFFMGGKKTITPPK